MCNFVPGQALAIGRTSTLKESLSHADLPGEISYLSLDIPRDEPPFETQRPKDIVEEPPFRGYSMAILTGVPHGLEVLAVSAMSAALSPAIQSKKAAVDLNWSLPRGGTARKTSRNLALSERAHQWASAISPAVEDATGRYRASTQMPAGKLPPLAVIDSGVDARQLASGREVRNYDYSAEKGGDLLSPTSLCDTVGHGTRVAKIIDSILPPEVSLISGRLGDDDDITVLSVSRAYADIVSRTRPLVVNLSLAPIDDKFVCPNCGETVRLPTFQSVILPFVFRLASSSTFTVMAAGNEGQEFNYRHASVTVPTLMFVVALDSQFKRAKYSSFPEGSNSSQITAYAFGGDDAGAKQGLGVFANERASFGTSFAAPFVSANVYACMLNWLAGGAKAPAGSSIGQYFHRSRHGGWIPDSAHRTFPMF